MTAEPRDLGLTIEQAQHSMQCAVGYEIDVNKNHASMPKHLRTGVNSALVEGGAVAALLIEKGVFTLAEYEEALRLGMNEEVARYQALYPNITFI